MGKGWKVWRGVPAERLRWTDPFIFIADAMAARANLRRQGWARLATMLREHSNAAALREHRTQEALREIEAMTRDH